jgi:prepilin-type N-terminal cleavage/methylation domain-containing protein
MKRYNFSNKGFLAKSFSSKGFSLLEMIIVVAIITIMVSLATPSYKGMFRLIDKSTCILNQRHIRDAMIVYYNDRPFVTDEDGFGDGEVFIDLKGRVVGDPSRDLSDFIGDKVFDCPSDGLAKDGKDTDPDYITDGMVITCINDNCTAKKYGGLPFIHDIAKDVFYRHSITSAVALGSALPPNEDKEIEEEPPLPPPPLLSEDFGPGAEDRWFSTRGKKYEFGDGYLKIGGKGEHRTFAGDETWTDYTIETNATLEDGGWGYGIYFRATDIDKANAYIFQYDERYGPGAFLFRKIVNGREKSPFARVYARDTSFGQDFDWYDSERNIKIEVVGNEYRAYVDDELVVVGTDDTYDHGMVGLRTWAKSSAIFNDMTVKELE